MLLVIVKNVKFKGKKNSYKFTLCALNLLFMLRAAMKIYLARNSKSKSVKGVKKLIFFQCKSCLSKPQVCTYDTNRHFEFRPFINIKGI